MRLFGRMLLVLAGATLPAVVAPIGCVVDSDRYPGLPNEIPNGKYHLGGGKSSSSSSSSSSTSSSGSSGTVNDCQCALTFTSPDAGACGACAAATTGASGACLVAFQSCTTCNDGIACVVGCGTSECIADCLKTNPAYAQVIACQCGVCAAECSVASPIACNLGAGGMGTGGAGGAAADAGDGG